MLRYCRRALALALVAFVLALPKANAQTGATKLIVPFQASGASDFLARVLGEEIGRAGGPTIVIENRPGAGSVIATEAAMRAAPDGTTLLIVANSFLINPHLKKQNYDPFASFAPICNLARSPTLLVVNSASPYTTLKAFLAAAQARPQELTMGAVGPATSFHLGIEELKAAAGAKITYVSYRGGAPAVGDLVGNHIASAFANTAETVEQVKAGTLRPLATGARTRLDELPDVPTVAEVLGKDYEMETWFGLMAPAGTPADVIAKLTELFSAALASPVVKTKIQVQSMLPAPICRPAYVDFLRKASDGYGRTIRESGIELKQ